MGLLSIGSLIDGLAEASGRNDVCRWFSLLTAVKPDGVSVRKAGGKP
jgi:hypothetical protein